jgi:hypothetical protein
MAPAKNALELTTRTIDRRTFYFRNLVVVVVLIGLVSIVWAIVRLSVWPLLGLLLWLPSVAVFFILDTLVVNRWRNRLLAMWTDSELRMESFVQTVAAIRLIPPGTLHGMLLTLPPGDAISAVDKLPAVVKRAVALTLQTIHDCERDRSVSGSIASALVAASVMVAIIQRSWIPLAGVLLFLPAVALARYLRVARWHRWRRLIGNMKSQEGLESKRFVEAAARLDWSPISRILKERLLSTVANGEER